MTGRRPTVARVVASWLLQGADVAETLERHGHAEDAAELERLLVLAGETYAAELGGPALLGEMRDMLDGLDAARGRDGTAGRSILAN